MSKYNKLYYEKNKEKIKLYRKNYYQENKESHKEYVKNRYEKKKNEINRKTECEICGSIVIHRMYKKHLTTDFHKKYMLCPKVFEKENNNNNIELEVENTSQLHKIKKSGWIEFQ